MSLSENARLDLMKLSKGQLVDEIDKCENSILDLREQRDKGRYDVTAAVEKETSARSQLDRMRIMAQGYKQQRDTLIGYIESQRADRPVSEEGQTYLDRFLWNMGSGDME